MADQAKLKEEIQGFQKKAKSALDSARAIQTEWAGKDEAMPKEVSDKLTGFLGQVDEYKARIDTAEKLFGHQQWMDEPSGTTAAHLGWREAGPEEGNLPVDEKSWREIEYEILRKDATLGLVHTEKKTLRYHVPLAVQKKGYSPAFEAYLHRGFADLGPQDKKTLSEGIDSAGGFTTPEDFHAQMIKKMMTNATIRSLAMVATTSRDIATWPKISYTTDNKYTSGARVTWTGESPSSSTVHRVTDPVFGQYSIPIHTAMASLPLTNNLIEDSAFDIAGISSDLLAEAFSLDENDAFINGTGVARPMGILTQVGGDGPAATNSGTASLLTADGLISLWGAQPSQYERNSVWLFSKATEMAIRKLKNVDNDYLWPIVTSQGNLGVHPRELLGFPTLRDEFMPAVAANAYPIIFGDLSGYLILDRVGFSIQRLTELYAETNITLLLARKRVGGQTIQPWKIQVQKVAA